MPRHNELATVFAAISESRGRGVTLREIMERTGLGRSTCRRHIDTLCNQDRIGERTLEPDGKGGRPPIIYFDPKRK